MFAVAALIAPVMLSAQSRAAAAPRAAVEVGDASQLDMSLDELPEAGVTPPQCPFSCTTSAQCTAGCKTEALCINHRCFEE
jgi:hypothetical protein